MTTTQSIQIRNCGAGVAHEIHTFRIADGVYKCLGIEWLNQSHILNLTIFIKAAATRSDDQEWITRATAEQYFGIITCGPYLAAVRRVTDEVLAS